MPEQATFGSTVRKKAGDVAVSPVTASLLLAFVAVGLIILVTGTNPLTAYSEMWKGATSGSGPRTVVNRAIPIVGMAIALSIPFRAGILNLGAEGQMIVGGLAAALTAIYMPGPAFLVIVASFLAGAAAGAVWALIPAVGQVYLRLPILISSLLLNAPARALTSYVVKYYFADTTATSTTTVAIPESTKIPTLESLSGASATVFLIIALVAAVAVFDSRTSPGYESFISGLNLKFARYGGVNVRRQTLSTMAVGGGVAGMVGAHLILGQAFRFVDNDLAGTGFAWTGLLVTLLAGHRAIPILVAGVFFAALQVGGLAMQRSAGVSWQLAQVLQAVVILALVMRIVLVKRGPPAATPPATAAATSDPARGSPTAPALATADLAGP